MDMLSIILLTFIWILNFVISAYNSVSIGFALRQPEYSSGWMKLVLYSTIVMAVCGFTWCYLIIVVLLAGWFNLMDAVYVQGALQIGYLLIIFPVIGAGLVMWVQSIINARKRKTLGSYAIAGWNTFANISNIFSAFRSVPEIFKNVGGIFKGGGDAKDKGILLMIIAIIIAVLAGGITTYCLIQWGKKHTEW